MHLSKRKYCPKCLQALRTTQLAKPNKRSNTTPEEVVRYVLAEAGVDYERHVSINFPSGGYAVVDVLVRGKIAIEVYGDYYHANPEKYPDDHVLRGGLTAKAKRAEDASKNEKLAGMGYKVIVVWEGDLKDRTEVAVRRMLDGCGADVPSAPGGYGELASKARSHLKSFEEARIKDWSDKTRDRRNTHRRERYETDLDYRAYQKAHNRTSRIKHRDKTNAKQRERYETDHDYRKKINEQNRKRHAKQAPQINAKRRNLYETDHDYRKKINDANNRKYRDNPDYREQIKTRVREYARKNKDEISSKRKARWAEDDDYRNAQKLRNRNTHKKRMSEIRTALVSVMGGACHKCGRITEDLKIRTNSKACSIAGHSRARGVAMQKAYVDRPADAVKFLSLACSECA